MNQYGAEDPTSESTDFADWHADVAAEVAENGLLSTWEARIHEILRYHSRIPGGLLGARLYDWLRREPELARHFDTLAEPDRRHLDAALAGQRQESRRHEDFVDALRSDLRDHAEDFPQIQEGDGQPLRCLRNATFRNWGRTVENVPALTCLPRTKGGVCNLVQWAAARDRTVRVSGYRHTWTDMYSAAGQVLVSLLPLDVVEDLPAREPPIDPDDQLQGIEIVGHREEGGVNKALCRIGAATTNEQFRRWCLDDQGGRWQWTVPLNVIMVEITWGGSNAPICHGAGWRNRTLSDLVTEIEFVNARGELQVVKDPQLLRTAAGCFGLLGVVTAVTLKLDPMSYAVMRPVKPRVALTLPPPPGMQVPDCIDMSGISSRDLEQAWTEFVARCENDYYAEWFWFPYQQRCWVNTWNNDGRREEAKPYPNRWQIIVQEAEEYLGQLLNESVFRLLPGRWQAELLARSAMAALPAGGTMVAPLIDALHFRHGIQNMRVLDMELEIPIPRDAAGRPDWRVCQRAWWAVIDAVCRRKDAPMRIGLEMRVMADSGVLMAPQFGNRYGTCAIEVLSTPEVPSDQWLTFMQEIADAWDELTDHRGSRLNIRPHWAKQWQGLRFRGMDVKEYLRDVAYAPRLPEFRAGLDAIARAGGYSLDDLRRRFGNPLLEEVLGPVFGVRKG